MKGEGLNAASGGICDRRETPNECSATVPKLKLRPPFYSERSIHSASPSCRKARQSRALNPALPFCVAVFPHGSSWNFMVKSSKATFQAHVPV